MRSTRLDLGLALAAAARGFKVRRKSDPDFVMKLHRGALKVFNNSTDREEKGTLFKYTSLTNFADDDFYVVGDDKTWLDYDPVKE